MKTPTALAVLLLLVLAGCGDAGRSAGGVDGDANVVNSANELSSLLTWTSRLFSTPSKPERCRSAPALNRCSPAHVFDMVKADTAWKLRTFRSCELKKCPVCPCGAYTIGRLPLLSMSTSNNRAATVVSRTAFDDRMMRSTAPVEKPSCVNSGVVSSGLKVDIVGLTIFLGK